MNETYALVGASSGIGQQVAVRLAKQGENVYAISRRGDPGEGSSNITYASCDVLAEEPTLPMIDGPINGLAYFSGTITLRPFHILRRKNFLADLELNYLSAVAPRLF